jgi:SAM-dependent methyltransferase
VRRHLPHGALQILDVGGGTGVHAEWLAADGHRVRLLDVSPVQVEWVRSRSDRFGGAVEAEVGDARSLPADDASVDAVLLLGPLYHLPAREDRLLALREAGRAVRPGGSVFVAAVSRYASLFDGAARGFLFDAEFRAIVDRDLATGVHLNPAGRSGWWTTAYFHRPTELAEEIAEAGLELREVVGLEGIVPWVPTLEARWHDRAGRDVILDVARRTERVPELLGLSPHLLAVAARPPEPGPSS